MHVATAPENPEPTYKRNFTHFLTDYILFSVAMGLLGTTTVIPDFVRRLTDSEILIGLSGNIFTIGYTLPQLFIAHYIVQYARKKWWFVVPNIPARFIMLLFAGIILWLGHERPSAILIAFFICYTIAAFGDGLVGVPWADLIGTSLDERWRARMFGLGTAITGVLMLLITPLIGRLLGDKGPGFPTNYAILFGISGAVFALSILPGFFIDELPGGKAAEERPSLWAFLPELGAFLRDDRPFASFILMRVFTAFYLMSAPFYIGFGTEQLGLSSAVAVPILLAMQISGSVLGSLIYTWLGAKNNVLYMQLALLSGALLPICALLAGFITPWLLYIGFFISGLAAGSNLFICYLNWLVGYTHPDRRPIYVGLTNTIAALFSFVTPVIAGTVVQTLGYQPLFVLSLIASLFALFTAASRLPKPAATFIT